MYPRSLADRVPQLWRVALFGMVAGVLITVGLNWLPAWVGASDIGGGLVIIGAVVAGALAATRSVKPSAAGFRTGAVGGVVTIVIFALTDLSLTWSLSFIIPFMTAVVGVLVLSPIFGAVLGLVGGWIANVVINTSENAVSSGQ